MKFKERRRVYITLTKEEEEIFVKAAILVASICDNMKDDDELAFVVCDSIYGTLDCCEVKNIAESLLDMQRFTIEII